MASIDLPLEELLQYMGSSPCPGDFDAFWDRGLEEMQGVKPNLALEPAGFQAPNAECFDLHFNGVGGSRIYAQYLRPANRTGPVPCLLSFHGYGGSSGDWWDKLPFVSMGFAVAAMDCRGQNGASDDLGGARGVTFGGHIIRGIRDVPEKLLLRNTFLDTARLAGLVMGFEEVDADRIGVFGGSQGGGLAVVCAALEPKVKVAAVLHPFLADYRRVWQMNVTQGAYAELYDYLRRHDPLHKEADAFFEKLGYIDVQNFAPRVRATVKYGVTLMDAICPPTTQFAVYNKITSPKSLLVYPDYGHELPPGCMDEMSRFLCERL